MKKQRGLLADLNKAGLGDLAADYAELGIDRLVEEGFLRELPGVKSIVGLIRTYRTARDHLFFNKINRFAESIETPTVYCAPHNSTGCSIFDNSRQNCSVNHVNYPFTL